MQSSTLGDVLLNLNNETSLDFRAKAKHRERDNMNNVVIKGVFTWSTTPCITESPTVFTLRQCEVFLTSVQREKLWEPGTTEQGKIASALHLFCLQSDAMRNSCV